LKWDMGILLTKVTHGVWDPKELRATTSCGNILCLGSGLSNTRQTKTKTPKKIPKTATSQKWTSYPTDTRQNPRLKNHEASKKKSGVWRKYLKNALDSLPMPLETLENERTDIPKTGCPASSLSSSWVTQSCFGTPSVPRVHLPRLHQEL
jgi:hypothetical protein